MDRDTFKQKYEEKHTANQELIESDHAAALFVRNPEKALKPLQEIEGNEFSFEAAEVREHITDQSEHQRRSGVPIVEDLARDVDGFDYDRVNTKNIQKYVVDSLKEATRGEEYGMVGGGPNGASEFAYVGDLDLDIDSV
jgi:hypothetical protein